MSKVKEIPQSKEGEATILGAMMTSPDVLDKALVNLNQDHFVQRRHKIIFETIHQMASKSLPIDPATITTALMGVDKGEDVGGAFYVSQIGTSLPTASHVEFYMNELKQKRRLRKLIEIAGSISVDAYDQNDPSTYIEGIERQFGDLVEDRQDENLLESAYMETMTILDKIQAGEGIGAISTNIFAVDRIIQGICPGMMDVYAAEAGCGKTSLAEQFILAMLLIENPVLIFQRDMTPTGFYLRLACRLAGVGVSQIRKFGAKIPDKLEEVKKWAKVLSKTQLKIYSPDGCTGSDVRTITRREKRRSGVKLVIIDHIRTLRHSKHTSWDGLEENSGFIRQSTNETGIPHVVLAHINREGAKSDRPTISNIKGGDQLKDDADNCCVMWRPDPKGDLKVWKVNFGFDKTRWDFTSTESMNYNGPKMAFEKIEEEKK